VSSTLADSLAAGDPAAFAALYDRLAVRLFNTARTLTSAADAEDIVHDLFVELARARQRLAGVIDLEAYVFTMLRHAVSRRRRRFTIDRKALGRIAADRLRASGAGESPPRLPDDDLAAALAALPAEQREVIALKIDGGLTFAEIAAVMHTSLNTAASRYRYALEKLRASLATTEIQR
jgi:RNA polymerase sigma-70 factor (ECF subfamily)